MKTNDRRIAASETLCAAFALFTLSHPATRDRPFTYRNVFRVQNC